MNIGEIWLQYWLMLIQGFLNGTNPFIYVEADSTTGNSGITFADGANKGQIMYDHDGDYMRFSTNGSSNERLRIDSSGRVGIGLTSPGAPLVVRGGSASNPTIRIEGGSTGNDNARIESKYNLVLACNGDGDQTDRKIQFRNDVTDLVTIDSSGRLLLGTTTEGNSGADDLTVATSGNTGITIRSGTSDYGNLYYSDATSGTGEYAGYVSYQHSTNSLQFATASTERLRIDSSGNVGIGSTAPGHNLEVKGSFPDFAIVDSDTTNDKFRILHNGGGTQLMVDPNNVGPNASYFLVSVDGTERMRIDSSGKVGIGTTNPSVHLHVNSGSTDTAAFFDSTNSAGAHVRFLQNGSAKHFLGCGGGFALGDKDDLALRGFDNILFATNDSSTERMRISNTGVLSQSTNTSDSQFYGNINVNVFHSDNDNNANMIVEHSGGNPYGLVIEFTDNNPDNNTNYFLKCTDSSTNRLFIYSDGDIDNHDNSYGAISDEKLKQDIIDAGSQWDDLKDLRVRKFKFKSDVAAYGDEAKTLIGVVAQEAELVSPGLVKESPDVDEDGNDLGTTTKSVRYSVLYIKAVKALQEAQTRIETLESQHADLLARVTALEAG